MTRRIVVLTSCLSLGLFVVGCGPKKAGGPAVGMVTQVVTAVAKQQPVTESLSLVGTIAANEFVEIKSETDGTIQEILFEEGEQVAKGKLLLRLDESKFAATVAEADANFKLSQANYDRAGQLFKDKLISQQEYDQTSAMFEVNRAGLDLMRRQLKDTRIYAPFSGIVGARQVSPGQVIARSTVLITLVDLDPVKLEVNLPERFLSQVRTDQMLDITVTAYPGRRFAGKVYFIASQLDPSTRTALIKALISNPQHELRPGRFASLELTLKVRDSAIVIPEIALMFDGDNARVFLMDDKETAQVRPVKLGLRLPGLVEIVSGVAAGDRIVVEGVQKVVPGAKLRVAP